MDYRKRQKKDRLSQGDIKLLIAVCIFFLAILLKFSNSWVFPQLRQSVNIMLTSGADTKEVVAAFGQMLKPQEERDMEILDVFTDKILNRPSPAEQEEEPVFYEDPQSDYEDIFPVGDGAPSSTLFFEETEENLDLIADISELQDGTVNRPFTIPPPDGISLTIFSPPFPVKNPCVGTLTSDFGYRLHPLNENTRFHSGIDIANKSGTKITALAAGTVKTVGKSSVYGNFIIITHKDGFESFYAHNKKILVKEGRSVKKGQDIAQMGSTGQVTGNHLHFEMRKDGVIIDPRPFAAYV